MDRTDRENPVQVPTEKTSEHTPPQTQTQPQRIYRRVSVCLSVCLCMLAGYGRSALEESYLIARAGTASAMDAVWVSLCAAPSEWGINLTDTSDSFMHAMERRLPPHCPFQPLMRDAFSLLDAGRCIVSARRVGRCIQHLPSISWQAPVLSSHHLHLITPTCSAEGKVPPYVPYMVH